LASGGKERGNQRQTADSERPVSIHVLFMTLFLLLWLAMLGTLAIRPGAWEAWLKPWLQVKRPPARGWSVWQREWGVFRLLFSNDLVLRPARAVTRAGPPRPAA
jgi:hypothetical protein